MIIHIMVNLGSIVLRLVVEHEAVQKIYIIFLTLATRSSNKYGAIMSSHSLIPCNVTISEIQEYVVPPRIFLHHTITIVRLKRLFKY